MKTLLHYDELVFFGDNHNDISMIEAADGVAKLFAAEMRLDDAQ